jgi:ComF family protein
MLNDFFNLLFPEQCLGGECRQTLSSAENLICTHCMANLPKTGFHLEDKNPVFHRLSLELPINSIYCYLKYFKSGLTAHLLHALKYGNRPEVGYLLGCWFGHELKKSGHYPDVDLIIPVPLHRSKLRKRGYNQSLFIANGFAEAMKIEVNVDILIRQARGENQALQKNRLKRWENVNQLYGVISGERLENKHVLIIDDVITTGATIEACALPLLASGADKISVASIALAM